MLVVRIEEQPGRQQLYGHKWSQYRDLLLLVGVFPVTRKDYGSNHCLGYQLLILVVWRRGSGAKSLQMRCDVTGRKHRVWHGTERHTTTPPVLPYRFGTPIFIFPLYKITSDGCFGYVTHHLQCYLLVHIRTELCDRPWAGPNSSAVLVSDWCLFLLVVSRPAPHTRQTDTGRACCNCNGHRTRQGQQP